MIHVVFQQADVAVLKKAIELDPSLDGEVVEIRDEFAVGPLTDLDTEEGWKARLDWWKEILGGTPYSSQNLVGSFDDRETVRSLQARLDDNGKEVLWIWMGQNQHDVCGYYWLVSQLKNYQGRVIVLFLGVKTDVLQQDDIARFHAVDIVFDTVSHAIVHESDGRAQHV